MKTTLFLVFVLVSLFVNGQDSTRTPQKSKIEKLSIESGILLQKEFTEVGTAYGIKFEVVKVVNLKTKIPVRGLRLSFTATTAYSSSKDYTAFIDEDELTDVFKTIEYIKSSDFKFDEQATDVEVMYASRGGFKIGCFSSGKKWKFYLQLDKYYSGSYVFINNNKDMDDVISMFTEAKKLLGNN